MRDQSQVRLILFFGVLGVTSSAFIIRAANQPSYILAGMRVLLTGIISFVLLNSNRSLDLSKSNWLKIIIAGISLATHFGWWFDSLNYLPIGTSLSLTNTAPVWMAIFLLLIFGTRLKNRQIISIFFVILGSVILFIENQNKGATRILGLILAIGSAIGFAIYLIMAREMVPVLGLWRYFGLVNLVSALVLLIWSIPIGQISSLTDPNLWFYGILLALIPGISGHAIYNWSIPKLDTIDVGVATLGEPILGTIIAWIFLSEVLSVLQILGIFSLIIAIGFTIERNQMDNQSSNLSSE